MSIYACFHAFLGSKNGRLRPLLIALYQCQNGQSVIYSYSQILITVSLVSLCTSELMKSLTSSRVLWSLPEKARFILHHIFSAGFSSGEYGGIKSKRILVGIFSFATLWNAPLSSNMILNSSGFSFENSSKKT